MLRDALYKSVPKSNLTLTVSTVYFLKEVNLFCTLMCFIYIASVIESEKKGNILV